MVLCGGGLAARTHRRLFFPAGKRAPAAFQEAPREEPEAPQGERDLESVMNLKDKLDLQEGRVTGPITGPEAGTGLCDTAVCWLLKERLFWLWQGSIHYNVTQIC